MPTEISGALYYVENPGSAREPKYGAPEKMKAAGVDLEVTLKTSARGTISPAGEVDATAGGHAGEHPPNGPNHTLVDLAEGVSKWASKRF